MTGESPQPKPVLDTNGKKLNPNSSYRIISVFWGALGGDVYLGKSPNSDAPCPDGVFRYNSDVGPSVGNINAYFRTMLLETGGTIGQADSSYFKIVKSSKLGYNLLYCPITPPFLCPFCREDNFCAKVGVVIQNGKRRLALVNENPLDVYFKEV
ncbi:hypothetical protein H5410_017630 [Solanum commersonii]|uniref:Uncharacterized protein n=1 Tax=Solanum commersonii TaxID=4109 RepID=A0A9J5ZZL9_SOLCO|nr:hypothetical protein H5410_017630 [Solanum commersonii]